MKKEYFAHSLEGKPKKECQELDEYKSYYNYWGKVNVPHARGDEFFPRKRYCVDFIQRCLWIRFFKTRILFDRKYTFDYYTHEYNNIGATWNS